MSTLAEMLALADVRTEDTERAEREARGRDLVSRLRAKRRVAEEREVDPRVVEHVLKIDEELNSLGERIEWLYNQANAASSIDSITAGELQARVGVLRETLSNVYEAVDAAKARIAAYNPKAMTP